ncbi:MAG: ABC transporter substrate-binding protein [Clostridiales bacterium]|nr:ABC transporter substrate-binding protein [Clostridiales bacterium]
MRKNAIIATILLLLATISVACRSSAVSETEQESTSEKKIVTVGFSQLGAESDWRSANTESMLTALSQENGFNLIYKNGQQKQANQVTALRMFIQQEVDYIVLAPETETGWDFVLGEAKEAGIPVIIVDRRVAVDDSNLYTCWVGSDFALEGKKLTAWINAFTELKGIDPGEVHIAHIQGTLGSTAQIGRTRGLNDAVKKYGWDLLGAKNGDFTEVRGREVMAEFLREYNNINVVYCENDNEAIGAIDAIEAAGKRVGPDIANGEIMVVSFDGINTDAQQYLKEGKISCIAECNPLHGPRVQALIKTLEAGETPEKYNYVQETLFSSVPEIKVVTVDESEGTKEYQVEIKR